MTTVEAILTLGFMSSNSIIYMLIVQMWGKQQNSCHQSLHVCKVFWQCSVTASVQTLERTVVVPQEATGEQSSTKKGAETHLSAAAGCKHAFAMVQKFDSAICITVYF